MFWFIVKVQVRTIPDLFATVRTILNNSNLKDTFENASGTWNKKIIIGVWLNCVALCGAITVNAGSR